MLVCWSSRRSKQVFPSIPSADCSCTAQCHSRRHPCVNAGHVSNHKLNRHKCQPMRCLRCLIRRRRVIERLFMNTFIHLAPPYDCNRLLDDLTISHRRVTALRGTLISAAELLDDKRAGAPPQVIAHRRVTCGDFCSADSSS